MNKLIIYPVIFKTEITKAEHLRPVFLSKEKQSVFNHTLSSNLKLIHNESNNRSQIYIIALYDIKTYDQGSLQYTLLCSLLKGKKIIN